MDSTYTHTLTLAETQSLFKSFTFKDSNIAFPNLFLPLSSSLYFLSLKEAHICPVNNFYTNVFRPKLARGVLINVRPKNEVNGKDKMKYCCTGVLPSLTTLGSDLEISGEESGNGEDEDGVPQGAGRGHSRLCWKEWRGRCPPQGRGGAEARPQESGQSAGGGGRGRPPDLRCRGA